MSTLSHSPVVPPGLSALVLQPPPCRESSPPTAVSTPPSGLGECFLINSLVVRLPYCLIFWQFWLFFVFKFVVVLLFIVRGGTVCLTVPPSWPEVTQLLNFLKLLALLQMSPIVAPFAPLHPAPGLHHIIVCVYAYAYVHICFLINLFHSPLRFVSLFHVSMPLILFHSSVYFVH